MTSTFNITLNIEGEIRRSRWISLLKRENTDNTEDNFKW